QNAELAVEAFVAGCPRFGNVPRYAFGHSFGGVLTSLFLSAHPQLFERAVLLDPELFPRRLLPLRNLLGPQLRTPMADADRRRRTHVQDAEEAYARLKGRGVFRGWEEEAMRAHVLSALREEPGHGVTLTCPPEREAAIF